MMDIVSARGWSWGQLGVGALCMVLLLRQVYRWTLTPLPWRQRGVLLIARVTWSLLLIGCLWEPVQEKVVRRHDSQGAHLVTMVDVSKSMSLLEHRKLSGAEWCRDVLRQVEEIFSKHNVEKVSRLAFGDRIRPWSDRLEFSDSQSLIVDQLGSVVAQQSEAVPTLLFLLTDGQDTKETSLKEIAPLLQNKRVKVFPILPTTQALAPPTGRIVRLSVPERVTLNQEFHLDVDLRFRTAQESEFQLWVETAGHRVFQKVLTQKGEGLVRVSVPLTASREGSSIYEVRLMTGDGQTELSRRRSLVMVKTRELVRVLFIQGALNWELRYLKYAIANNASLALSVAVRFENGFVLQQENRDKSSSKMEVLDLLKLASKEYDAIVLVNVTPEFINPEAQQILLEFIQKRGGGILFFGTMPAQVVGFKNSLLEQILPVVIDSQTPVGDVRTTFRERFKKNFGEIAAATPGMSKQAMTLTPEALQGEIWRDSKDSQGHIAQPIPTFENYVRLEGVKPASTILAVHPEDLFQGKPRPLMVSQNVGAGRSVFLGIDALHPWRLQKPEDYDRFWQQLLFWLGARAQDYSIVPDRDSYLPGEKVKLRINVRKLEPSLRLTVSETQGAETEMAVEWDEKGGEGRAEFIASKEDDYIGTLYRGTEPLMQRLIEAQGVDNEKDYSGVNLSFLRRLASESGGECISAGELKKISSFLESRSEDSFRKESIPVWHTPWVFIAMLGAYVAELWLRQKFKLS